MTQSKALPTAVIFLATAGVARAQDLSGDSPSFVLWFWICHLLIPSAALQGHFKYGLFAWAQVPLILLALGCTWVFIRQRIRSAVRRCAILGLTYLLATSATNQWAFFLRRDRSMDFPIAQALTVFDYQNPPSENEIVARFGQPLARKVCGSNDFRLPPGVFQVMKEFDLSSSIILAYRETAWGREITHFLLLDPHSARLRTALSMNSPYPEPIKWPSP
jgi:hypothetical protein